MELAVKHRAEELGAGGEEQSRGLVAFVENTKSHLHGGIKCNCGEHTGFSAELTFQKLKKRRNYRESWVPAGTQTIQSRWNLSGIC